MHQNTSPTLIYLADPVHNFIASRENQMIPLSALNIGSYIKNQWGEKIKLRIFKFPEPMYAAIEAEPPDIVGVSNYIWNSELGKSLIRFAKKKRQETVTVMGGPNVTQTPEWMAQFLEETKCDYFVADAGEHPFNALVTAYDEQRSRGAQDSAPLLHEHDEVHGIWYRDQNSELAVLKPTREKLKHLDDIPDPFTNGMVDEFFEMGLAPMIETNRGCPFHCTFCVWGVGHPVTQHTVDYSKGQLRYCAEHSKETFLLINDANFGLYKKKDLELAKYIRDLAEKFSWPSGVFANWGQVKSKDALEIAEILNGICLFRQATQSTNEEVLKTIKRRNVSDADFEEAQAFTNSRGIPSFAELILMLPGETMDSYLDSLRYMFKYDVDRINTNQLQLLEGSEMNTDQHRAQFGMRTRRRLLEAAYGSYEGYVSIESEELVIETNTFSAEDCRKCRALNWLLQMGWTMKRHDLLFRLGRSFGISPADFLMAVVEHYASAPTVVVSLFNKFFQEAEAELFPTEKVLHDFYSQPEQLARLKQGGFGRMNTVYSGLSLPINAEILSYYEQIFSELVRKEGVELEGLSVLLSDCLAILSVRCITLRDLENIEKGLFEPPQLELSYDLLEWEKRSLESHPQDHFVEGKITYEFGIDEIQRDAILEHMEKFSGLDREFQLRKFFDPNFGIKNEYTLLHGSKLN